MDKDLRDDTLKLVRYKILFVKRELEYAFAEKEDLVYDNLDGTSFAAWKVAEFIQSLSTPATAVDVPDRWDNACYPDPKYIHPGTKPKKLRGLPEEDKKYLRVHFEVLDRSAREKFKYEEQHIDILRSIRKELPAALARLSGEKPPQPGVSDPYAPMHDYLQLSKSTFECWRNNFARNAESLGRDLAGILNEHRKVGTFESPEMSAANLAVALRQTSAAFNSASFVRFTGPALGDLRLHAFKDGRHTGEFPAPPVKSIWGETKEAGGVYVQRITGSGKDYVDPENNARLNEYLGQGTVDLTLNKYSKDLGMVSWVIFYQNHKNHMRSIGYEVATNGGGVVLWINQLINTDMTPTLGRLPTDPFQDDPVVVGPNQFIVSVDSEQYINGKRSFCVHALHVDFDFDRGTAVFHKRLLKMLNEVVKLPC